MQKPLPKFEDVQRIRLNLPGGYFLSVVQGPGTYSGEGTVAVMVLDKNGDFVGDEFPWTNADGLVKIISAMKRRAKKEDANV